MRLELFTAATHLLLVCLPCTCRGHRYGDEQHLDEALNRIWMFGRAGNPPKKMCPKLVGLREETVDVSHSWLPGIRRLWVPGELQET